VPAHDVKPLKDIARKWKNYDPRLYDEFLKLLDLYTFDITVAVTEANSVDVLQAQGRAQQARKFIQIFSELPE
jgi:hypothetical protein